MENFADLEDVSESDTMVTENGKEPADYEHEEGEISEDDIMVEKVITKSVTSEVVIYDDRGRTAIFTSPVKEGSKWTIPHYAHYSEGRHADRSEFVKKRKSEEFEERVVPKKRRYSTKESKKPKKSRRKQKLTVVEKEKHRAKRHSHSSSSESDCSCISSCSSCSGRSSKSSGSSHSLANKKRRGKENKRLSPGKLELRSSSRASHSEYTSERLPSPSSPSCKPEKPHRRRDGTTNEFSVLHESIMPAKSLTNFREQAELHGHSHRKEISRRRSESCHLAGSSVSQNSVKRTPVYNVSTRNKRLPPRSSTSDRVEVCLKDKVVKDDKIDCKDILHSGKISSEEEVIDLTFGDRATPPPPGSLGEMLLKKTKRGKLKAGPVLIQARNKGTVEKLLDLETPKAKDEFEKTVGVTKDLVLNDIVDFDLDQEDEDELQLRLIALQSSLKLLNDVRKEGESSCAGKSEEVYCQTYVVEGEASNLSIDDENLSQHISLFQDAVENLFKIDSASDNMQDPRLDRLNVESDCIAVHDRQEKGTSKLTKHSVDERDLPDCNQDLVDMEICDSSPEDDFEDMIDDLKEVGEDIALDENALQVSHTEGSIGPDSYQQNSFQIPVEWAYMLPPPPPPDQPDNDIGNISSWSYDQTIYLQSMQNPSHSSADQMPSYDNHVQMSPECESNHFYANTSVFGFEQHYDNETDLTSNLLNLPQTVSKDTTSIDLCEEAESLNVNGGESLRDQAAHQYQAFMSAMIQKQNSQSQKSVSNSDRNLIEVNIVKSPTSKPFKPFFQHGLSAGGSERNLIKVNLIQNPEKSNYANTTNTGQSAPRKRRRSKKKLHKIKARELIGKRSKTIESKILAQEELCSASLNPDEEDEDLLRAQLLIDLSRKKMQREQLVSGSRTEKLHDISQTKSLKQKNALGGTSVADSVKIPLRKFPTLKEAHSRTVPFSVIPVPQNFVVHQTKMKESSPTLQFRKDLRHLSDIGGFGLDPKNSRYDFTPPQDLNARKDLTKLIFPPIKPVIIDLHSDSSDDETTDEQRARAECSNTKEAQSTRSGISSRDSQASASIGSITSSQVPHARMISENSSFSFSSSLDMLLKTIRNNKPNNVAYSKSGFSVRGQQSLGKSKAEVDRVQMNSTPNVVRHLSHTQQAEYHWLKEQLRRKESLQRQRLQQQKKANALQSREEELSSLSEHSSPSNDQESPDRVKMDENETKGANDRKDNCQAEGLKQIHHNNALIDKAAALETSEDTGQNSNDSTELKDDDGDDDDEETLRLMVLQTLQRRVHTPRQDPEDTHIKLEGIELKKSKSEGINPAANMGIHQKTNYNTASQQAFEECTIMIEDGTNHKIFLHTDEIEKMSQTDICSGSLELRGRGMAQNTVNASQKDTLVSNKKDPDKSNTDKVFTETLSSKASKIISKGTVSQISQNQDQYRSKQLPLNRKVPRKRMLSGTANIEGDTYIQSGDEKCSKTHVQPKKGISVNIKGTKTKTLNALRSPEKNSNKDAEVTLASKLLKDSVVINKKKPTALAKKNGENEEVRKRMKDLLERLEKEYTKKRIHMNEVILQLDALVQEATDEERERQSLKQNIDKLRLQLSDMELQLEKQAFLLKSKMARIRKLQTQMINDRQIIKKLEEKGEMLGKQVVGSHYVLRKVLESPNSKSAETMRKRQLAHNISALREQMRDMCNKSKAKLHAATASAENTAKALTFQENQSWQRVNIHKSIPLNKELLTGVVCSSRNNSSSSLETAGIACSQEGSATKNIKAVVSAKKKNERDHHSPLAMAVTKSPIGNYEHAKLVSESKTTESKEMTGKGQTCVKSGEKLDEMNELCPYDLLGRCNDDSCTYQHLRQTTSAPSLSPPLAVRVQSSKAEREIKAQIEDDVSFSKYRDNVKSVETMDFKVSSIKMQLVRETKENKCTDTSVSVFSPGSSLMTKDEDNEVTKDESNNYLKDSSIASLQDAVAKTDALSMAKSSSVTVVPFDEKLCEIERSEKGGSLGKTSQNEKTAAIGLQTLCTTNPTANVVHVMEAALSAFAEDAYHTQSDQKSEIIQKEVDISNSSKELNDFGSDNVVHCEEGRLDGSDCEILKVSEQLPKSSLLDNSRNDSQHPGGILVQSDQTFVEMSHQLQRNNMEKPVQENIADSIDHIKKENFNDSQHLPIVTPLKTSEMKNSAKVSFSDSKQNVDNSCHGEHLDVDADANEKCVNDRSSTGGTTPDSSSCELIQNPLSEIDVENTSERSNSPKELVPNEEKCQTSRKLRRVNSGRITHRRGRSRMSSCSARGDADGGPCQGKNSKKDVKRGAAPKRRARGRPRRSRRTTR